MTGEKILTMNKPICKCYSKLAVISSLLNVSDESRFWFYTNYLNLIFSGVLSDKWVWLDLCGTFAHDGRQEWECIPFIECEKVNTANLPVIEIEKMILSALTYNKAVYCNIDFQFLLDRYKEKYLHDVLIVGYNDSEKTLLCKDYFGIEYQELWIPLNKVVAAFSSKMCLEDRIQNTYLLKARDYSNQSSWLQFKTAIEKYLASEYFIFREPLDTIPGVFEAYGIHIYDGILEKMDFIFEIPDIKPFYALRDHFIIVHHLAQLLNNGTAEAAALEERIQLICLLVIKNKVSPSMELKEKIQDLLRTIKGDEICLLNNWLKII